MRRIRTIICLVGLLALLCTSGRAQIVGPPTVGPGGGAPINPGSLTAPSGSVGTIAQYSLNGDVNVASPAYVANPRTSAVVSTTAVTNGTTAVTLGAANGWVNGEGIAIYGAGANCNINSTGCGSITVGQATVVQTGYVGANSGTTQTYVYQCTATDANYGAPAAGIASASVSGPVVLSEPNTTVSGGGVNTGGNYNTVTCPTVTGAAHYVWWRNTASGGNLLWALTDVNTLNDWSNHQTMGITGPFTNTPPAAAQADVLTTTVASGGGTTSIVLGAAATQTGTFTAWPDATAAFQAAYAALPGGGTITVPAGFYKVRTINPIKGVTVSGAGGLPNAAHYGTVITGTPGYDVFSWTTSANGTCGFRNFLVIGGRNAFANPIGSGALTYITLDNIQTASLDYASINFSQSAEEWYGKNCYFGGGWYGIVEEAPGGGSASTIYLQKTHFIDTTFNGQAVNAIHQNTTGANAWLAVTFDRTIVQSIGQDGVWLEGPDNADEINGYTDEGVGTDFVRTTGTTPASACTSGTNVVAITSTTGLNVGDNFTVRGCGANSGILEGTICTVTANTSVALQDVTCTTNTNAGTTTGTALLAWTNARFDNVLFVPSGSQSNVRLRNATLASSGGCCGGMQTRWQVNDHGGLWYLDNIGANSVAVQNNQPIVGGSVGVARPTLAAGSLQSGILSLPNTLPTGGANYSLLSSALGGDIDLGLVDSTGNSSGTFGTFRVVVNNASRGTIFSVNGTTPFGVTLLGGLTFGGGSGILSSVAAGISGGGALATGSNAFAGRITGLAATANILTPGFTCANAVTCAFQDDTTAGGVKVTAQAVGTITFSATAADTADYVCGCR